jgi:DNA-binding NarL/FixJ family response regulator
MLLRAPLTVVVVDERPIVRVGVRRILEEEAAFLVVDAVSSAMEAMERHGNCQGDVFLVGQQCGSPGLTWLIRHLGGEGGANRILVMLQSEDTRDVPL